MESFPHENTTQSTERETDKEERGERETDRERQEIEGRQRERLGRRIVTDGCEGDCQG